MRPGSGCSGLGHMGNSVVITDSSHDFGVFTSSWFPLLSDEHANL